MRRIWWWMVGCAAGFLAASVLADDADLTAAADCGCLGDVELAYRGTEQEFVLRAQFMPLADPATPYTVWVQEATGSEIFHWVGDMSLVGAGGADWRLELRAIGQAPPALGVSELSEMSGRLVEVRESGGATVVLWGALPAAVPPVRTTGEVRMGRLDLQRPANRVNATGYVDLRAVGVQQTFTVRSWKLDWAPGWPNAERVFAVLIETGAGTGEFAPAGYLKRKLKVGSNYDFKLYWELKLWSSTGAPSALGVADLAELAGRRAQVRDDLDRAWLETVLPALALKGTLRSTNWRVALSPVGAPPPDTSVSGLVKLQFNPRQGRSRCSLTTRGLVAGTPYTVFVEDGPGLGSFSDFAALDGRGRLRRDTRAGERLPAGVPSVLELSGRVIEIRDPTGTTLVRGQLP